MRIWGSLKFRRITCLIWQNDGGNNVKKENHIVKSKLSYLVTALIVVAVAAAGLLIGYIATNASRTSLDCFTITDGVLTAYEGDDRTVTIPDGVVVIAERVFIGHEEIEKVVFPTSLTTLKNGAFYGCTSLKEIKFSSALNFIGDAAFGECQSLTEFTLPASVQYIHSEAFYNSLGLTSFSVESGNPNYVSQDGVIYSADMTNLIAYPAGRTDTSFTLPDTVEVIASGAFAFNTSLQTIDLGNVREIGERAFLNCTGLTGASLPGSVETVYKEAFSGCTALATLEIAEGVQVFGESAFAGCTSLARVEFPESMTEIGRACFVNCTALTYAGFPAEMEGIYETAFDNCENLTIHGYAGSPAEAFASEYGIPFEAIA